MVDILGQVFILHDGTEYLVIDGKKVFDMELFLAIPLERPGELCILDIREKENGKIGGRIFGGTIPEIFQMSEAEIHKRFARLWFHIQIIKEAFDKKDMPTTISELLRLALREGTITRPEIQEKK